MSDRSKHRMVNDALVAIETLTNLNLNVFDEETRRLESEHLFHCVCQLIFSLHKSYDLDSWDEFIREAEMDVNKQEEVIKRMKPYLN